MSPSNRASLHEPSHDGGPAVMVWTWMDAPEEYRELSAAGGGERWVAHVPSALVDLSDQDCDYPAWIDSLDAALNPQAVMLGGGDIVVIAGR